MALVAAVATLAIALVAVGWTFLRGADDTGGDRAGASARTQTTLLVQLVDDQHRTVAAALMAHDTAGKGTGFGALVPASLVVTSPGQGSVAFSATSAAGSAGASAEALADLLGVRVDGTLVLDQVGLGAMVDAVGGVDVTVDRDVTRAQGGSVVVLVPAGTTHLSGAQAAAYATFLAPDEAEQQRLARFSSVWQAVLGKLPSDGTAVRAQVSALGSHGTTTLPAARLAAVLAGLRADQGGQRLAFDTVPTRPLDGGTGTTVLVIDTTALPALLQNGFAGSVPTQAAGAPVRVVVQNGVGTPGLVEKARARLVDAGLSFVTGSNADHFGYPHSYILILDAGERSRQQGEATARALRLPVTDVTVTDQGQTLADVVVVLGADFKP